MAKNDEEDEESRVKKIVDRLIRKPRIFSPPHPGGWPGRCADCGKPVKWCECD